MSTRLRHGLGVLCLLLWLPASAGAESASPQVPWTEGIRAEDAGDWETALRIYRDVLARQPEDPDLWLRVADIEARLGHAAAAAAATERAARQAPDDPVVHDLLARAYSVAGRPFLALEAAERALELDPSNVEYLHARAQLANWCGRYELALESYERILEIAGEDQAAALGRARAEAWIGELDEAARHFRTYLERYPEDGESRLEYARTETWRGNYPVSHALLEAYRRDLGATEGYLDDRTRVLLGAGRPNAALAILAPRLESEPESFELHVNRTLALAASGRPKQALESLEVLSRLGAGHPRTAEVNRIVRTPLRSTAVPMVDAYRDSDGVELTRFGFEGGVSLAPGSRLGAGIATGDIRADAGSGLEPLSGRERLDFSELWLGLSQRLGPRAELEARVGDTEVDGGSDLTTYRLNLSFELSETFDLTLGRQRGFYLVSPRALELGIDQTSHRVQLSWRPGFRHHVDAAAAWDSLSDGNDRRELVVAPRRTFLRREHFNLDLGLRAWWFRFDRDLDNGYYDPSRYESYAVTGFGYWKISDDSGLSLTLSAGVFEDDTMSGFELGGSAAIEWVTGVYRDWMLKVRASGTENERVQTGAFNAWGGGIFLTRRFGRGGGPAGDPPVAVEAVPRQADAPLDLASHFDQVHPGPPEPVAVAAARPAAEPERSLAAPAVVEAGASSVAVEAAAEPAPPAASPSPDRPGDTGAEPQPALGVAGGEGPVETPSAAPPDSDRIFELQLGLFHHERNARRFLEKYQGRGHQPYLVEVKSSRGETRYTVRLGPYPSMEEALAMAERFRRDEGTLAVVRYRSAPDPAG